MTPRRVSTCIVGGGPAGLMLGLLLAERGADVLVLEGHEDFEREFRGEVLQPSTAHLPTSWACSSTCARSRTRCWRPARSASTARRTAPFFPLEGLIKLLDDWARDGLLLIG